MNQREKILLQLCSDTELRQNGERYTVCCMSGERSGGKQCQHMLKKRYLERANILIWSF